MFPSAWRHRHSSRPAGYVSIQSEYPEHELSIFTEQGDVAELVDTAHIYAEDDKQEEETIPTPMQDVHAHAGGHCSTMPQGDYSKP